MIRDMNKFQTMTKYKGDRVVEKENDFKPLITHIGNTLIVPRFSLHWVQLQNIFHVSGMKKNILLSAVT